MIYKYYTISLFTIPLIFDFGKLQYKSSILLGCEISESAIIFIKLNNVVAVSKSSFKFNSQG